MTHETIKQVVEQILKKDKKARDDDFLLTMKVYLAMGFAERKPLGMFISYKNIEFAPAFETITRIRREIQNTEGRLKATMPVQFVRQIRFDEMSWKYSSKGKANMMANSWMAP